MLIIAKGRPIEIRCYYATDTDGNNNIEEESIKAFLAGTAVTVGADYIQVKQDAHGDTYYRLRFEKWYTLQRFNTCSYALKLRVGDKKMRFNDIFTIDCFRGNDNTNLPIGDTVIIKLTIKETPTGQLTWAEDITVPGTLECIRIGGHNYYMDERVIELPDYPSGLAELQEDILHQTVTAAQKQAWNDLLTMVSPAASEENRLIDQRYVDEHIASASATFRGTNTTAQTEEQLIEWANSLTHDTNDYVFWRRQDQSGNVYYSRYKFDGEDWLWEYDIAYTVFTPEQWAAIDSGVSSPWKEVVDDKLLDLQSQIDEIDTHIPDISHKLDNTPTGAHNKPIFINDQHQAEAIDSLDVEGDVHSGRDVTAERGVSAGGIGDLSIGAGGGPGGRVTDIYVGSTEYVPDAQGNVHLPEYPETPEVVRYNDLDETAAENINRVPTAAAAARLKADIGMDELLDSLDLYDPTHAYVRGDMFKVSSAGRMIGYRVRLPIAAGQAITGRAERITYSVLARPLEIVGINDILVF